MTTQLSKSQLSAILNALEGERRNPNTRDAALKALGRHAERLGLSLDDVLSAAAGLLDGRMSAEAFCASLEPESLTPRDEARSDGVAEDDADAIAAAESGETSPPIVATGAVDVAPEAVPAPAEIDSVGSGDDPLAIPRFLRREAETEPTPDPERRWIMPAVKGSPSSEPKERKHRDGTKEALVIEMLRRPEGATIAQIIAATGWQAHTVRGAFAGALKKKRGLTVKSEKADGAERVYWLAE